MENKPNSDSFLVLQKDLFTASVGMCVPLPALNPTERWASRTITIYFFPHMAAPGVTPSDPAEIDFVVEPQASANES